MLKITFKTADGYAFPKAIQLLITKLLTSAEKEVRVLLPMLADEIDVGIYPTKNVITETGENARTLSATAFDLALNPWDDRGVEAIARKHCKSTLFHEVHHMVRMNTIPWREGVIDFAIFEGLATVFERDYAIDEPPWGSYDPAVIKDWTKEAMSLDKETVDWNHYSFSHPDGRSWILYRVGAYVVDQAIKHNPSETAATLVDRSSDDIVELAQL